MADAVTLKTTAEKAQSQAMAQQYLEEMGRLRDQMEQSRRELEQARGETGSLMAQINALFPQETNKA